MNNKRVRAVSFKIYKIALTNVVKSVHTISIRVGYPLLARTLRMNIDSYIYQFS